MKNWFPFTDYDFYAYLTSGMLLIAAVDHIYAGGILLNRSNWSVADYIFWSAMAYFIGQILAIPSAVLLEHLMVRTILRPPVSVLLGLKPQRRMEFCVAFLFGIREYRPLPTAVQNSIKQKIQRIAGEAVIDDPEAVFQVAFPHARSVPDSAVRLDTFINQYGFARNVSFTFLVVSILFCIQMLNKPTDHTRVLLAVAATISLGLFLRFLKFYAAHSSETLRTFNRVVA
ncbi:MAG: hypothetical protein B7Y82_07120 [Sphingomonadales bacterium 32-65-25]|nr:MAG: hypothetical protein B7Y82_07120 [Sphingomonadales bacterium 32-65-25]